MSGTRVKAKLWVQAALRLGSGAGRPGVVVRSGDADAGGILVVLRGRQGCVVLSQVRAGEDDVAWLRGTGETPVGEAETDAYVSRQVGFDPDLWVVEFEAPDYRPPFAGKLL